MGQELQIPDSFKNKAMAKAFAGAGLDAQDDNLAEGIGQSYGVVGYKGKTWSLRIRGERHNILDPATGAPSPYLDAIILGQAKTKSKSFYKQYMPGTSDGDRPICSSIDGITPDADVQQQQSDHCATCPRNVWKNMPNGKKGRECTDYKRLAILILPTQTKPILGTPLIEPVFLRVPPDSLNSLAIMGETMAAQGYHYSSYITRIVFDPNKAHPSMVFRPLQGLTDQEAPVILEVRSDPMVGRITGIETPSGMPTTLLTQTAATGLTAPAAPATQGVGGAQSTASTAASQTATLGTSSSVTAFAQPATPSTQAPAPSASATSTPSATPSTPTQAPGASGGIVDTGFGGATPATQQGAAPTGLGGLAQPDAPLAPAAQTVQDAGEPEDTDAELDARIASLITAK
jgi:hypothetical protein